MKLPNFCGKLYYFRLIIIFYTWITYMHCPIYGPTNADTA